MQQGFIKVAAATPKTVVADCDSNVKEICEMMCEASDAGAKVIVFPELAITGYTCSDLFWQETLLKDAKKGLTKILFQSRNVDALVFVGLPWEKDHKLYNVAAILQSGKLLGLIPKRFLPGYAEFYETRHFTPGNETVEWVEVEGVPVPFGTNQIFACKEMESLTVAVEICEDLWVPNPPSVRHAMAGADLIVNLSASDEVTGKNRYRTSLVSNQSARLICGYIYASAGEGESTQDLVFSGHNLIAENGNILTESQRFGHGVVYGVMDLQRMVAERRRMGTYFCEENPDYIKTPFHLKLTETKLERWIDPNPFVPGSKQDRDIRCEEILMIQAMGLKKRVEHTNCQTVIVGISGGLDSTLALLVMAKTCDLLGMERSHILAVTMPCFGTTDRTYQNACTLTKKLRAKLLEVDIKESVSLHFKDIGHDPQVHDVTYENGQARERTQVLMDLANQTNGMVIGTGDMSELALGWATYNGDHMSMYAVNSSVPKTLVRHLVAYYADTCEDLELQNVLQDVLDTPVSPELLPPKDGKISQKTEDLVGPYELHDFFLYYVLRCGFQPAKIYRLACHAYDTVYEKEVIFKWLKKFYWRYFSQQFKRSCLPDGPKVGSVAVSPRGDLRMPSDASVHQWMKQLDKIGEVNGF